MMRDPFWRWAFGIGGVVVAVFVWLIWSTVQRDRYAPCEDFASFPITSVPVRCHEHFHIGAQAPGAAPTGEKR